MVLVFLWAFKEFVPPFGRRWRSAIGVPIFKVIHANVFPRTHEIFTKINQPTMMLLISLVAVASAAVTLNQVDPDAVQTSAAPSTSACHSAQLFNGTNCNDVPMCAAQYYLSGVDALATAAPISLEPGRVVGTNSLEIIVQHAAVQNRIVTRIVFNESNVACNYPGANWRKGVQTNWALDNNQAVCRDTYVSSIPWDEECALARHENATHVWFDGVGTVEYSDALGEIDGVALDTRQVASVIKIALYQPKMVRDITTAVRVYDEPRLLGAVTRQLFDFRAGTATLTVVVSLAAPLRTTSVTMITGPAGILVEQQAGGIDSTQCGDSVDAICRQKYTYTLDPQQLCQFDGAYVFNHAIACHPSVANTPACPLEMTAAPLTITVLLDSEDICEVVQGLLSVDGTITPHGAFELATFGFGAVKRSFLQEQAIYFQVKANSLNGFAFESSSIALVEAENKAGVRQTLYDATNGGATPGWSFAFNTDPANAVGTATTHRHEFSFLAAPAVFGDVERNLPVNSDVVVAVQVAFVSPVGPGGRKRHVATLEHRLVARQAASNERTAQADTNIQVEASTDQGAAFPLIESSAATNHQSRICVAIAVLSFLAVNRNEMSS
jgi:hypothetical protein